VFFNPKTPRLERALRSRLQSDGRDSFWPQADTDIGTVISAKTPAFARRPLNQPTYYHIATVLSRTNRTQPSS